MTRPSSLTSAGMQGIWRDMRAREKVRRHGRCDEKDPKKDSGMYQHSHILWGGSSASPSSDEGVSTDGSSASLKARRERRMDGGILRAPESSVGTRSSTSSDPFQGSESAHSAWVAALTSAEPDDKVSRPKSGAVADADAAEVVDPWMDSDLAVPSEPAAPVPRAAPAIAQALPVGFVGPSSAPASGTATDNLDAADGRSCSPERSAASSQQPYPMRPAPTHPSQNGTGDDLNSIAKSSRGLGFPKSVKRERPRPPKAKRIFAKACAQMVFQAQLSSDVLREQVESKFLEDTGNDHNTAEYGMKVLRNLQNEAHLKQIHGEAMLDQKLGILAGSKAAVAAPSPAAAKSSPPTFSIPSASSSAYPGSASAGTSSTLQNSFSTSFPPGAVLPGYPGAPWATAPSPPLGFAGAGPHATWASRDWHNGSMGGRSPEEHSPSYSGCAEADNLWGKACNMSFADTDEGYRRSNPVHPSLKPR